MRKRRSETEEWSWKARVTFVLLGVIICALTTIKMLSGKMYYRTYWGAPVYVSIFLADGNHTRCGGIDSPPSAEIAIG
jgi:hypothetical protein